MALTYGFYNSVNGDRKYNATQFCDMFDGVINDGVFDNVAGIFGTVPGEGLQVLVKSGRAWFNKTWNYNDASVPLDLDNPDVVFDRIDTVVLEVDARNSGRVNSLKVVKGTPSTNPIAPALTTEDNVYWHPLSNVRVRANTDEILASDITVLVGTSQCPFVTAILQTTNIDVLYANWEKQFLDWFNHLKEVMNDNVVTNLQNQIDNCVKTANKATTAQAQSGSDDTKWMTPLKTKQAIANLGIIPYYKGRVSTKNTASGIVVANWFEPIAKVMVDDDDLNAAIATAKRVNVSSYAAIYFKNKELRLSAGGQISKLTISGVSNVATLTASTTETNVIYFLAGTGLTQTLYKKTVGAGSVSNVINVSGSYYGWSLDPYRAPADTWVVSASPDRTYNNRSGRWIIMGYNVSAKTLSNFTIPVQSGYNDGGGLLCYRRGRALCQCIENQTSYIYFLNLDTNTFTLLDQFSTGVNPKGFSDPSSNYLYYWYQNGTLLVIKGYNQSGVNVVNKNVTLDANTNYATYNNPIHVPVRSYFYFLPSSSNGKRILAISSTGATSFVPSPSTNFGPSVQDSLFNTAYDGSEEIAVGPVNGYETYLWNVATGKWNYLTDGGVLNGYYEQGANSIYTVLKKGDYILAKASKNYLWMLYNIKAPRISGAYSITPPAATEWE